MPAAVPATAEVHNTGISSEPSKTLRPTLLSIDYELTGYQNESLHPHFVQGSHKLLSWLKAKQQRATFFCVGELLEKFPELIQEIQHQGHEIACHGWRHIPLDKLTPSDFERDLHFFLDRAHQLSLKKIAGFRAPFFSLTTETQWATAIIKQCEFLYDSSILPCSTLLYGDNNCPPQPHTLENGLIEVPVTVWKPLQGINVDIGIPALGGTYLRLMPQSMLRYLSRKLAQTNQILMPYCHPYDFDTDLKKIQAFENNPVFNFLLTLQRHTMKNKLELLLEQQPSQTIQQWLQETYLQEA